MKIHAAGVTYAKSLIARGAIDLASDWMPGQAVAAAGDDADKYLAVSEDTPSARAYPFVAADGTLVRAALKHCVLDCQQPEIVAAAKELLKAVDDHTVKAAAQRRPTNRRQRNTVTGELRQWYRMSAAAQGDTAAQIADIYIYDDIGEYWNWDSYQMEGVSAKSFLNDLKQLPASVSTIRVHINCRGGDVFDALAIANGLRQHQAKVDVIIEGLCASAATIVSCAGDVIEMADNALFMVHRPSSCECGTAEDFRAIADSLDGIMDAIIATYRWVSPLSAKALKDLVVAETYMGADEALANGFVTTIVSGLKVAATLDRRVLNTVPEQYRARVEPFVTPAPVVAAAEDVIRLCREANCSALAESLVAAKLPLAEVTARIDQAKTTQATATARSNEITALCATAKVPELASGYIASAMALEDVRAHLVTLQARMHGSEIDSSLKPGSEGPVATVKNTLSPTAIYADRNKSTKKEPRQ